MRWSLGHAMVVVALPAQGCALFFTDCGFIDLNDDPRALGPIRGCTTLENLRADATDELTEIDLPNLEEVLGNVALYGFDRVSLPNLERVAFAPRTNQVLLMEVGEADLSSLTFVNNAIELASNETPGGEVTLSNIDDLTLGSLRTAWSLSVGGIGSEVDVSTVERMQRFTLSRELPAELAFDGLDPAVTRHRRRVGVRPATGWAVRQRHHHRQPAAH